MSSNIGSAALVLTTDASQLHAGLKKEGDRINAWSKSMRVSASGFKNDQAFKNSLTKEESAFLAYADKQKAQRKKQADDAKKLTEKQAKENADAWKLLGKGAAVVAVAAGAAAYAGIEKVKSLVESFKTGNKSKLDPVDVQKLAVADQSITNLGQVFDRFAAKGLAAFSPFIDLVSQTLQDAMKALEPVVSWVGRAFSTHWGIIVDIVSEVVQGIWEVIVAVKDWVVELFGLGETTTTIEEVITGAWKVIAKGAAYVWDTLKAGVGVMAYVSSFIVEGLSKLVDAFKETIKALFDLAGQLPDAMGGQWFRDQSKNVDKWGGKLKDTSDRMKEWAKGTWKNFGGSADDVEKWFNKRANRKPTEVKPEPVKYSAATAAVKDSAAAYSIEAKFRTENTLNPTLDLARKQLAEQVKIVDAVKGVEGAVKTMNPFEIW